MKCGFVNIKSLKASVMPRRRHFMISVLRERGVTERANLGRAKESLDPLSRAITIGQRIKLKERLPPSSRNS